MDCFKPYLESFGDIRLGVDRRHKGEHQGVVAEGNSKFKS
jgi:hypothetical protein